MSRTRRQKLRAIFDRALARTEAERAPFVLQACAGDPTLAIEVDRLLAAHERAGSFLDHLTAPSGPGNSRPETLLEAGTSLGPYQVVSLLGKGGMGEVYRARDSRLGRDVAIKILPRCLTSSAERLARFEQEARAASALNHANIVAVYDVGAHDGVPYLVTELLEGRTLAVHLRTGPPPLRKAIEWGVQLARGLSASHECGIVHRDLKPENVFVTRAGQLKILDFGIAKLSASERASAEVPRPAAPATSPGAIVGTLGYMSPEQERGAAVDFRSDQFSLGCVLYELLCGQPPFACKQAALAQADTQEEELLPLHVRRPAVPLPVAWVVERCLARDPDDRYASTRDLYRDLELTQGRDALLVATRPSARRTTLRAWLAIGLFLTLAISVSSVVVQRRMAPPAVASSRYLTYGGSDTAPAASPDGKTVAFASRREGRHGIWLIQSATGEEVPLTEGEDDHPRFSPDGAWLLFSRASGGRVALYRLPAVGGVARKLVDDALFGDYSPDSSAIAFVRQPSADAASMTSLLATARADGSSVTALAHIPGRVLVPPRWSPDGASIAVTETSLNSGQHTTIALVDVASGRATHLPVLGPGNAPLGIAWAGSRRLAYAQPESLLGWATGSSSRIVLQHIDGGAAESVFFTPLRVLTLDVLRDGRVVHETGSYRVNLQEMSSKGEPRRRRWLTRGNSSDRQPSYSADAQWVVFSSNRGGNLDLWAVSRRSGAVRRLTDDASLDWDPSSTRDGKLLWSSNRTGVFEIWQAEADGSDARQITHDGVNAENPGATPDGRWLVYASGNPARRGILRVRRDGTDAHVLVAGHAVLPELSPDGRYVAFVAGLGSGRAALRVARVDDGARLDFEVPLPAWVPAADPDVGRCRWLPDGRALVFIGREADGSYAVYRREFLPDVPMSASVETLLALEPNLAAESLAVSPDGESLTVAYWDRAFNLMLAENVGGIADIDR